MKQKENQIRNICYNCKHGGSLFRIVGKTHLHCEQPMYWEQFNRGEHVSPWETLRVFWGSCENFTPSEKAYEKFNTIDSQVESTNDK